jgi:hypothetical protein
VVEESRDIITVEGELLVQTVQSILTLFHITLHVRFSQSQISSSLTNLYYLIKRKKKELVPLLPLLSSS